MPSTRRPRVLIVGAASPASVSIIKALRHAAVELFVADAEREAVGLALVPAKRRLALPKGERRRLVSHLVTLCREMGIDALLPTVDHQPWRLAEARPRLARIGTQLMLSSRTDEQLSSARRLLEVSASGRGGTWPAPEVLAGDEYWVDVLRLGDGVEAAVPRVRLEVAPGGAVTERTLHDPRLERLAKAAAAEAGVRGICCVRFKRDTAGTVHLLGLTVGISGTLPLTLRAGVNLPLMWLESLLGRRASIGSIKFREVTRTRLLDEAEHALLDMHAPERDHGFELALLTTRPPPASFLPPSFWPPSPAPSLPEASLPAASPG